MSYYRLQHHAFPPEYLSSLQGQILTCPYFTVNNLNRDFVDTKGFSLVFQRSGLREVEQRFPFFKPYLSIALQPLCNAFYLNPLLLKTGSRVEPHIDRSLRSYCKTILPPELVSVLYVHVPPVLEGGELVLRTCKRQVAQIRPQLNTLLFFQGDLTHSVKEVTSLGSRLSLVCEQYSLNETELQKIPEFKLESRAVKSHKLLKRNRE
ncbi:MAG: 2OG-Fe(II) oxygenase [Chamaesiphon sp.]